MKLTIEIEIPELETFRTNSEQIAHIEQQIKAILQANDTTIDTQPGTLTSLLAQAQAATQRDTPDHLPDMVKNAYANSVKYYLSHHLSTAFSKQYTLLQGLLEQNKRYRQNPMQTATVMESGLKNVERHLGQAPTHRIREQAKAEAKRLWDAFESE